ncbi:MAG: hypothetical protein DMG65_24450 [Candidatus Angelobacter sp. Gp1-AA117]|nr:MAG: hypothetical protein DMG65_24450 [Candidatus Angelobacter sp. Gp1-AA117]
MKRAVLSFLVVMLGLWLLQAEQKEERHHRGGASITTNDNTSSDDCSEHLQVSGRDSESVVRGEQTQTLPNQPLNIRAEHNGGIQVTTWDRPEFSIKLCKQVASSSDTKGRSILDETKLVVEGATISVSAPSRNDDDNDYSLGTLLMVKAPKDANVNLSVRNGGISLHRFSGTAEAHAENGGISVKQSTGKLTLKAQNGGVAIKESSGEITANVQNGGLSLALPERWDGKGLDAHTENGGLVVTIPRNFNSGLEVSGSEHVSIVCRGTACDNGQRTWENGTRMFRLGNSPAQIHATTVNGGIVIQDAKTDRAEM